LHFHKQLLSLKNSEPKNIRAKSGYSAIIKIAAAFIGGNGS
jgi:hypothetical protein